MSRRHVALGGLAVAGAAAAAVVSQRRTAGRAVEDFYQLPLERAARRTYGLGYGGPPFIFHRSDSFQTFHAASFEAVRDALPSADLHPVRLPGGRAVVSVSALQHHDITASGVDRLAALPYGEILVVALVTRRPAPPLLPLVAPPALGLSAGAYPLHVPVTSRLARDVGRLAWGWPKFVADMEFAESTTVRSVHLSEGGRDILTLTIHPAGRPAVVRESLTFYSVLGGQLIEVKVPSYGVRQMRWGSAGGELVLGDHQVADELRSFDITARPFLTVQDSGLRLAMSAGRPVGLARPYLGYVGDERDLGRYVVRYPNTAPIDRYAPYAPGAGPGPAIASSAPAAELASASGRG